ncbi:hypothetical protein DAEQUDRAFT_768900 [Daedalea quercina L-15889]|uniref:Uncharacterized protein n=1 Tax=Daedalea quercina L-15889 TaxID=1314783 RepID=A0A165MAE3_9APHY|nr:hypothetical protein DAEQUDRAFT_768900 [Daedalea quercina L-15889]
MADKLRYGKTYWEGLLQGTEVPKTDIDKLHMVFSLIIFLGLSLGKILAFAFTTNIVSIRQRAGTFLTVYKGGRREEWFGPAEVYNIWHEWSPVVQAELHGRIIKPCMERIAVAESDAIIEDKSLKVQLKTLTIAGVRTLLDPVVIASKLRALAPFTHSYLHAFATSPNEYRQKKARKEARSAGNEQGLQSGNDEDESVSERYDSESRSEAEDEDEPGNHSDWRDGYPGFSRNPTIAILVAIMMLAFVRNRATNALALPLGLFFSISGTSSRVLNVLSNIGLSVSVTTIEDLKARISKDAIDLAVALITSGTIFYIIFDNINLYLRKFQERISNRASMIHATNSAVVALPGIEAGALDLNKKLVMRGKRAKARFADIRPTRADGTHMKQAFGCLIGELLVHYTPGSRGWKGRTEMLEAFSKARPTDRPLPVEKTDFRPFGVFECWSTVTAGVMMEVAGQGVLRNRLRTLTSTDRRSRRPEECHRG